MVVHDFGILDNLPFAIYALSGGHDILYANKALRDALGGPDLVGGKCSDVLNIFDWCHDPAQCLIDHALSQSGQYNNRPVRVRFSGTGFHKYLLWTSRSGDTGKPFVLVCLSEFRATDQSGISPDGEIARRLDELTAINRITTRIARTQELQEVLRLTLREVIRVLGGDKGVIYLRDGDRFLAREKYGVSDRFAAQPKIASRDVGEWGFQPVICDVASAKSQEEGIHSWISVPLTAAGRPTGLIIVTSGRERHFLQAQMQFMETIANDVGMAVANAELLEKVMHMSVRDPLTGLFNRLRFEEKVKEPADHPVSVCVIDLDGLKLVNNILP